RGHGGRDRECRVQRDGCAGARSACLRRRVPAPVIPAPMNGASPLPAGLVLAAGAGRRLGRGPKALLRVGGLTLVESIVNALLAGGCADVAVVTGAGAAEVAAVLPRRPDVVAARNPDWDTGMGSSVRHGLRAIGPGRDVLLTPVDRPGI